MQKVVPEGMPQTATIAEKTMSSCHSHELQMTCTAEGELMCAKCRLPTKYRLACNATSLYDN